MQTVIDLDDGLVADAREMTGIHDADALLDRALRELIHREASRRLSAMGGMMPNAWAPNEGDQPPA